MTIRNKSSRYYTYFRRGHNVYLSLLMWSINTITVVYVLLSTQVPLITALFPDIFSFSLAFGISYIIICTISGWHDYNKGTWIQESAIHFKNNPEWCAMKDNMDQLVADIADIKMMLLYVVGDEK